MRTRPEFLRDLREAHRVDERLHARGALTTRRHAAELIALRLRVAELEAADTQAAIDEPGLFDTVI